MEEILCTNCGITVSEMSFQIHQIHCSKKNASSRNVRENLEEIKELGSQTNRVDSEGYQDDSALEGTTLCNKCKASIENKDFEVHLCLCDYCDNQFCFNELLEHMVVCGNRTDFCDRCNMHILLRDFKLHRQVNNCRRPERPKKTLEELKKEVINYIRFP